MIIKKTDISDQLEELKFSMPENVRFSGRLLIIGGSSLSFSNASKSLSLAVENGAGNSILALPDNLKKLLPKDVDTRIQFLPSEKIGSFSADAFNDLLSLSLNSNTILISGELGRGSQTAQTILSLVKEVDLPLIVSDDANLFLQNEDFYLERENIYLFLNLSLVQRLLGKLELISFKDQPNIVENKLEKVASQIKLNFVFWLDGWLWAVFDSQVFRIKMEGGSGEASFMPELSARFASIKTWSKAEDILNLSLAIN
jgi:hypothetical protein